MSLRSDNLTDSVGFHESRIPDSYSCPRLAGLPRRYVPPFKPYVYRGTGFDTMPLFPPASSSHSESRG